MPVSQISVIEMSVGKMISDQKLWSKCSLLWFCAFWPNAISPLDILWTQPGTLLNNGLMFKWCEFCVDKTLWWPNACQPDVCYWNVCRQTGFWPKVEKQMFVLTKNSAKNLNWNNKTFYCGNLSMFVIIYSVCSWQVFLRVRSGSTLKWRIR